MMGEDTRTSSDCRTGAAGLTRAYSTRGSRRWRVSLSTGTRGGRLPGSLSVRSLEDGPRWPWGLRAQRTNSDEQSSGAGIGDGRLA